MTLEDDKKEAPAMKIFHEVAIMYAWLSLVSLPTDLERLSRPPGARLVRIAIYIWISEARPISDLIIQMGYV